METFLNVLLTSFFFILFIFPDGTNSAGSCDDWEAYKDETCLKIFESPGLLSYQDAESFCAQQETLYESSSLNVHLLSIDLEEKQQFIETFLKSNNIVDNVWIGLKYINGAYQWSDGTRSQYTNWASDSPKNNDSYCVEIETESSNFGLWSDQLCSKKNLVICERIQLWPMVQLQTAVRNLMKEVVSVGFIYVQLPDEKAPTEIWPSMEWEDISASYAGIFFRTVGGNAGEFGQVQEPASPRLTAMKMLVNTNVYETVSVAASNQYSSSLAVDGVKCHSDPCPHWSLQVKVSNDEVRPRNMAVRIWKRIK